MREAEEGAASGPFEGRRVLVVSSFDSFVRSAVFFADDLARRGASVDYVLAYARKNQLSSAQSQAAGLKSTPRVAKLEALATEAQLAPYDVVLLALDGARTRRFMLGLVRAFRGTRRKRPLIVSMYPGLLFRFHLEGMLCRMSCDLFLLNSKHDYELYRSVHADLGLRPDNALLAGLSVVPSRRELSRGVPETGSILFVGQPTVPAWRHERLYLLDRLAELAARHPSTQVVIKPRHRRHEKTLHTEHYHLEDLLNELRTMRHVPDNLVVRYEPVAQLLSEARLCITVSSTAALEALMAHVPTRIISDLGVHEHLGNHFFLESGLLCELDALHPDLPYVCNRAWMERHVESAADHVDEVAARLTELLANRDRARELPLPNGRLFGRPRAYDEFILRNFGERHLGLLAESRARKLGLDSLLARMSSLRSVALRAASSLRSLGKP